MKYGNIKYHDVADGVGVRTTIFVSGCTHHCRGCFQPETWDFDFGQEYTADVEEQILGSLKSPIVDGLTLLGGEPFEPENQRVLVGLLRQLRERYGHSKNVWCYSGYTWEELTGESRARCEVTDEMISYIDVLVDGEFVESKKNLLLRFRGSENQRIIDVGASLSCGEAVIWSDRFRSPV